MTHNSDFQRPEVDENNPHAPVTLDRPSLLIQQQALSSPSTPQVDVVYASATGTAEDLSADLYENLEASGSRMGRWCAADEYDLSELASTSNKIVVFVLSTCGDGEAPRHLQPLWAVLRRADLPRSVLSSLRFALFGLGDSAYPKFNAAARRLFARFVQLSATPLVPLIQSLGDESGRDGLHGAFVPWMQGLAQHVCPSGVIHYPGSENESTNCHWQPTEDEAVVTILSEDDGDHSQHRLKNGSGDIWMEGQAFPTISGMPVTDATVTDNSILTNSEFLEDDREVRHIELDASNSDTQMSLATYKPGDVLHTLPRNRPSAVDAFFSLMTNLDIDPNTLITIEQPCPGNDTSSSHKRSQLQQLRLNIRMPCTVRQLVSAQFDLWAIPQRRFLRRLARFATQSHEREKLLHLSSADGADDLSQYAYRERRTVLMTLRDFPSARPPLSALIHIIPRIRPRAFSIASSPLQFNRYGAATTDDAKIKPVIRFQLCVAQVRYVTPLRFKREGLCSGFLSRSEVGHVIPVALERAESLQFHSPLQRPALLIATGTGIAPMRSFLMHHRHETERSETTENGHEEETDGVARHDIHLIFGCRSQSGDYLYREELQRCGAAIVTAFSREDKTDSGGKVYVQHRLGELHQIVWDHIHRRNGVIYVAGAAGGMPKSVRQTLVDICNDSATEEGIDASGEQIVRRLEIGRRLQMECW